MNDNRVVCHLIYKKKAASNAKTKMIAFLQSLGDIKEFVFHQNKDSLFCFVEFINKNQVKLACEFFHKTKTEIGYLTISPNFEFLNKNHPLLPEEIILRFQKLLDNNAENSINKLKQNLKTAENISSFQNPLNYYSPISSNDEKHCSFPQKEPKAEGIFQENNPVKSKMKAAPAQVNIIKPKTGPLESILSFLGSINTYQGVLSGQTTINPNARTYLLIKNLNMSNVKLGYILNLLGCVGNVTSYLIDKETEWGLFGFTQEAKIDLFASHFSNQMYFGKIIIALKVETHSDILSLPSYNGNRFLVGAENKKNYRYQQNLIIKFNPPSHMVHVTNVSESLNLTDLTNLFSRFHHPVKVLKLNKKSNTSSEMYVAEFSKVFQCIEILSIFHNTKIVDRSIKISFSHTKIDSQFNS